MARFVVDVSRKPLQGGVQVSTEAAARPEVTKEWQFTA